MKIRSYKDIGEFERSYSPYCGYLIAALLKDFYLVGTTFTRDGPLCFRESATFRAAVEGKDLVALFDETKAVEAWLQWTDGHEKGVPYPGNPTQVLVDWNSGVFRGGDKIAGDRWFFGCVQDVQHALFDRREWSGRELIKAPSGAGSKFVDSVKAPLAKDPLTDIRESEPSLANEPETTRQSLIDARLGQGAFREALMMVWAGKCAVTKCATKVLLRASHIKPWRDSSNNERLDRFNGLLLNPNLDAAFDRGLISFADTGEILFHPGFSSADRAILGISPALKLVYVYKENKPYLAQHRHLHGFPS